jgi:hypothetical protein
MREILGVTQDSPRKRRRWFHDEYFDLFVSQASDGDLDRFELCYGLDATERALVWDRERGYFHDGTDLLAAQDIAGRFDSVARALPGEVAQAVLGRLQEYAKRGSVAQTRRKRFRRADWQQRQA